MTSYHIRFKDGSFHHMQGIGFSTPTLKEAAKYWSLEAAKKMVWELCEVDAITHTIKLDGTQAVEVQY